MCDVSFIVSVALCVVFCLNVVCYFVRYVYFCVLCLIVVPLPPCKNPLAVQLNNNNNNNNNKFMKYIWHFGEIFQEKNCNKGVDTFCRQFFGMK
jgi:hypothetical protein